MGKGMGAWLLFVPLLGGCVAKTGKTGQIRENPGVILIITDDQGYGDLGCHGNSIIETPGMDRLYEESVRFTDFHASPTCAPTRAGIMTGMHCNRVGVWHTVMGRSLLDNDYLTMAEAFQNSGYVTGIFGKWHLGDNYPFRPQDRGFDEVLIHGGGGIGQTPDYWNNDYFGDTYRHNGEFRQYQGYCTDIWFEGALAFIRKNRNRPFFCCLSTNAPHGPYHVPEKYAEPYKGNKAVPDPYFYGMIANIDENLITLEKTLEQLGIRDEVIMIFMTDNGTSGGVELDDEGFPEKGFNAGMRGKKGSEYEGGHRVPLFIRWKEGGIGGGKDIDELAGSVDLLPTLAELCNLDIMEGMEFDGRDLTPLMKPDENSVWSRRVMVTDNQRMEVPLKWHKSATMSGKWRLINGTELYDVSIDGAQRVNLAGKYPDTVRYLRSAYEAWWKKISPGFEDFNEIILGSDQENPALLTCHDWHSGQIPPWNQTMIRRGMIGNGFWAVKTAREGWYEISLRRWPPELDKIMSDTVKAGDQVPGGQYGNGEPARPTPHGLSIVYRSAHLSIFDVDTTLNVNPHAESLDILVQLPAGSTRMQTWLTDDTGWIRGAYYVVVNYMGKTMP